MSDQRPRCSKRIINAYGMRQCANEGKQMHTDQKLYCSLHRGGRDATVSSAMYKFEKLERENLALRAILNEIYNKVKFISEAQ